MQVCQRETIYWKNKKNEKHLNLINTSVTANWQASFELPVMSSNNATIAITIMCS